ncbi:hypothetical protein COCSUDRAFT_32838 [Coccomyxa subellipsoidea C-169]|uniref:Uncharacterized protein n=1 Tax=Coccomyxa subellipsoidea (strain C-169) TaxID=574566 RepID=I0Z2F9_COCSC|nr:hypothetical protein COCSUDRAFT_32838 [Coccomyxa subellipsoidea C-169]EIE24828.1 hypothetical protein COCSUDRAFT_32838 [Coccomyxa subellipsoidea C-169]|eukprot:XP_005649372.1 hypothetical protein COCSUDRAFT_32838 [Coccomyxa subellipsoidea C-169]
MMATCLQLACSHWPEKKSNLNISTPQRVSCVCKRLRHIMSGWCFLPPINKSVIKW